MNFGQYKLKLPKFERFWNTVMLGNFVFMISLCIIGTALNHRWNSEYSDKYDYIFNGSNTAVLTTAVFFSFWLLTNAIMALNVEVSMQL